MHLLEASGAPDTGDAPRSKGLPPNSTCPGQSPQLRGLSTCLCCSGMSVLFQGRHLFLDLLQKMRTSSWGARRALNLSLPLLTSSRLCADLVGGSLSRAQSSPSMTSGLSCTQSGLLVKGGQAHAPRAAWGLRPRERRPQVLS